MGRKQTPKKKVSVISARTEARIVELCLQNPDAGARRLVPLLKKKKIIATSSQIYTVLKRHGLQTRTHRLARLKQKTAKKTPAPKKKPVRVLPEVEKQIIGVSLQHPEFGAKRLLPLLEAANIGVSASTVNSVLRRNGMGSRDRRLAKLAEASRKKRAPADVKEPSKITDEVGERIVQISLQNPEYGARRLLPLLEKDGILLNASAVYRVLKHANLENREKRLERSENQLAVEVMPEETVESPQADFFEIPPTTEAPHWDQEAIESVISDAAEEPELGPEAFEPIIPVPSEESESIPDVIQQPIEPPAEAPEQIPEVAEQKVPSPAGETQMFPGIMVELLKPPGAEPEQPAPEIIDQQPPAHLPADIKATKTTKIRGPWFLTMFNLLLLLLLGFLGFYAWQNVLWTDPEPELIAAIPPATDIAPAKPSEAAPPLSSYRMISERNLFNIAKEEAPAPKKEIDIEIIDPAKKNLGLKLVGTVVLDDSKYSVAIIDNQKISRQEAYREGDQANEVLIKKVMRNKVIIATEEGDKLLIVETETTAKRTKSPSYARQIPGNVNIPSQIPGQVPAARTRSINLDLEEVAAAFEDSEKLLQEVNVAPYTQGDQAAGLRLNRIPAKNIFRKMGLRSRDVIVGINGEPISGPEQVGDFIRTLGNGGEVTITIKRRRRTRQINLNIE